MVLRVRDEGKLDPIFPFDLVAAAPNGRRVEDAGRSVIYLWKSRPPPCSDPRVNAVGGFDVI